MEEVAARKNRRQGLHQSKMRSKRAFALAASDEKASYSLGYYPENKKWDGKDAQHQSKRWLRATLSSATGRGILRSSPVR